MREHFAPFELDITLSWIGVFNFENRIVGLPSVMSQYYIAFYLVSHATPKIYANVIWVSSLDSEHRWFPKMC